MRVCIVTIAGFAHGIGGMQQHSVDLAEGLVRAGHEVVVITRSHPEGEREVWRDGVCWRFIEGAYDQDEPTWLRGTYAEFVRAHAAKPFDVVHSESNTGVELVRRGVHRSVPFVVMFHGVFLGLAAAGLRRAARHPNPYSVGRELKGIYGGSKRHFRHGSWWRFRACEAIVPSRQQVEATRRSCLLERSRIHVVPNGIDVRMFRPRPRELTRAELGLGPEFLFVCVGRLNHEKGMHHAVRALAQVDGESRLVVVGDGEERGGLEALAHELRLGERVVFVGAQPQEQVARYLAASDAFLFPTERDEAAPLVLPQAMACGVPVIASATGGIPDVLDRPGANGLLVPPGDVGALTSSMRRLRDEPELAARLGLAGRRRVLAEFTVERMTERTVDVYRVAHERLRETGGRSGSI